MRIAYGVFGYGRGHATRALGVLPALSRRHQVLVFAGGDAHDVLAGRYPTVRVETLRFVYGGHGRRSNLATLRENVPLVGDLCLFGPRTRNIIAELRSFGPDLAICDAEPFVHRAARWLGVPRVSFDHYGVLAHCKVRLPFEDRVRRVGDLTLYRTLMGGAARVIVSSFFRAEPEDPKVRCVGPILREEVRRRKGAEGEHLLVYLNQGRHQLTSQVLSALEATRLPVRLYGAGGGGVRGRITFRPPGDEEFLDDLASARAVVSTAGNQLVGEALHFGKPLLVCPEASVEQRLNAAELVRLGVGMRSEFGRLAQDLPAFLERAPTLARATEGKGADGSAEALSLLESFVIELGRAPRALPVPA